MDLILTNREKELCNIMFNKQPWRTAQETAQEMALTDRTIETYLSNIYKKNNINTKEQLFNLWQGTTQKGFDGVEGIINNITEKIKGVYTISRDKEFYYVAGVIYGYFKSLILDNNNYTNANIENIENLFLKNESEQTVKEVVKKAYFTCINKLSIEENIITPLMAGVLSYKLDNPEASHFDLFLSGQLSYKKIYKIIQENL